MRRVLVIAATCIAVAAAAAAPLSATARIEIDGLLARLETNGCEFNRNGAWHSGTEAKAHLLRKLRYLDDRGSVQTAEQFIYFVNAQDVAARIDALVMQHQPKVLAVDMSRVPDIEYSALQALMEGERRATEHGAVVWLVGLNPGVLEVVRHAGLDRQLGPERMLFNARAAIERYQARSAVESAGHRSP